MESVSYTHQVQDQNYSAFLSGMKQEAALCTSCAVLQVQVPFPPFSGKSSRQWATFLSKALTSPSLLSLLQINLCVPLACYDFLYLSIY
jgi:hypothetical protein